jgi:hypothetical protein
LKVAGDGVGGGDICVCGVVDVSLEEAAISTGVEVTTEIEFERSSHGQSFHIVRCD